MKVTLVVKQHSSYKKGFVFESRWKQVIYLAFHSTEIKFRSNLGHSSGKFSKLSSQCKRESEKHSAIAVGGSASSVCI